MLLMHKAFIDGLLHHLLKGIVIVSCIQKHDRVGEERKPFPGQGFQQFFESSRASGKGDVLTCLQASNERLAVMKQISESCPATRKPFPIRFEQAPEACETCSS